MPSSFQTLGIRSDHEAAELERDLGIKFSNFTPEDRETWILQSVYLEIFSKTRVVSLAADDAGVSIRTARQWQTDNTLGFNQRLEIAVLRYTDVLEVMLLQRAQQPDAPPSLLMMLLRAHMPEKYGSARRSSAPRDDNNACSHDHDPQPSTTSQYDRELLETIFQDLQNLKQFTGLSEPDHTPIHPDTNPSPIDPTSVGAGFKPAPDLAQTEEENPTHSNLSPGGGETQRGGAPPPDHHTTPVQDEQPGYVPAPNTQNLNRRQRRELQRGANRQKSHLARAPN